MGLLVGKGFLISNSSYINHAIICITCQQYTCLLVASFGLSRLVAFCLLTLSSCHGEVSFKIFYVLYFHILFR